MISLAFSLFADVEVRAITDLTPSWFRERDIHLLLLDFDNTIVPYTHMDPGDVFETWLRETRAAGVTVMVVSNSRRSRRVPAFCDAREIPWIHKAAKPSPKGILRAMEQQGISKEHTAMVGDQTFTDVLGGNLAGVTTVLVQPIDLGNPLLWLRHQVEMPFIALGRKKRSGT